MDGPKIQYALPTSNAWERMRTILFRPFDIAKWFLLGFSVWLASLAEGGASFNSNINVDPEGASGRDFREFFEEGGEYISANLAWLLPLTLIVLAIIIALFLLTLWLSSRGKMMFIDNLVYNRALVSYPWKQFKEPANSLFKWRIGFSIISFIVVILPLIPAGWAIFQMIEVGFETKSLTILIISFLVFFMLALVSGYIGILLEDFITPLMHKYSLKTTEAWRRFLPLHRAMPGKFVLYFLWRLLLGLAAGIAILTLCLATCCIGLILLCIPYIGVVVLLPLSVFIRSLSLEFLRQFGEEFDVFPEIEDPLQLSQS